MLRNIKKDFPIFEKNPWLIYFDNAATSQKPKIVIEELRRYYEEYNANVHRGIHRLSEEATNAYEKAREKVASFINAKPEEIIFTKNSTESLNLIAYSLRKKAKKVTTTIMEHHSNFVPWQQIYKDFNIWDIDEEGRLLYERNESDIYAVVHASNVLGAINDVKAIKETVEEDAKVVVDASQSAPHLKIDVKKLDVDFLAFTGHKMLASTGIGVLYIKKGNEKEIEPFLYGGEMIKDVSIEKTEFAEMPHRFEAGTPNIAEAISLGIAIDYLNKIGMDEIRKHEIELTKRAMEVVEETGFEFIGPKRAEDRTGLVAFYKKGIHPHDLASLLDKKGIAIRSGMHCAHPLHKRLDLNSTARASFYIYNDLNEIEKFGKALEEIKNVFRL